ncbi:hypothetical protein IPL68_00190 [Candidatus Saccharibacteria bacterium]|nr:MAG: hypothetical protein IPL68_00190 [Candidatus Saccharibacteria bacterium]
MDNDQSPERTKALAVFLINILTQRGSDTLEARGDYGFTAQFGDFVETVSRRRLLPWKQERSLRLVGLFTITQQPGRAKFDLGRSDIVPKEDMPNSLVFTDERRTNHSSAVSALWVIVGHARKVVGTPQDAVNAPQDAVYAPQDDPNLST